jgi:uncharacterized protein
VILVDANILLYAHVEDFPQHEKAREWLDAQLSSTNRVGLPWESLLAFVRLVTNPRIFPKPESASEAWGQVEAWLGAEPAWIPTPIDRHRDVLGSIIDLATKPELVPDAHLAALAIEHGLRLMSSDGDFARFPGLQWQNPLLARTDDDESDSED